MFESLLMPKSLMQECYKLFTAATYQFRVFCHFCHICCVLHMGMSSTCVLNYAMPSLQGCLPCIFVIYLVTTTSMQTRLRDIADFSPCSAVILMTCKLDATERSMHILRYFSKDIHPCPCLQLRISLACHFLSLLLL